MEQMEKEVEELKVKLLQTRQQLRAEREAEKLRREQVQGEDTAICLEKMMRGKVRKCRSFLKHGRTRC